MNFQFQELFYRSELVITPNTVQKDVSVVILRLQKADEVILEPKDSATTDTRPNWVNDIPDSGTPWDYTKVVRLGEIDPKTVGRIVVLRAIDEKSVLYAINTVDFQVNAVGCGVKTSGMRDDDLSRVVKNLNLQIKNITSRVNEAVGHKIPVKHYKTSDTKPHSLWVSNDWTCSDVACLAPIPLTMQTLYVHPYDENHHKTNADNSQNHEIK
jgi:hypothetical protein